MTNKAIQAVLAKIPQPQVSQAVAQVVEDPPPISQEQQVILSLPESFDIEADMDWAYSNISIDKPDFSTAPSRSCPHMLKYAREARSEFIGKYMAMKQKGRERKEEQEKAQLDTKQRLGVIDELLRKLPVAARESVGVDEIKMLLGVP